MRRILELGSELEKLTENLEFKIRDYSVSVDRDFLTLRWEEHAAKHGTKIPLYVVAGIIDLLEQQEIDYSKISSDKYWTYC